MARPRRQSRRAGPLGRRCPMSAELTPRTCIAASVRGARRRIAPSWVAAAAPADRGPGAPGSHHLTPVLLLAGDDANRVPASTQCLLARLASLLVHPVGLLERYGADQRLPTNGPPCKPLTCSDGGGRPLTCTGAPLVHRRLLPPRAEFSPKLRLRNLLSMDGLFAIGGFCG